MQTDQKTETEKSPKTADKSVEAAIMELEKSFGAGSVRKSKLVSRAFTLNEIVKEGD